jgi:hypothetical protein
LIHLASEEFQNDKKKTKKKVFTDASALHQDDRNPNVDLARVANTEFEGFGVLLPLLCFVSAKAAGKPVETPLGKLQWKNKKNETRESEPRTTAATQQKGTPTMNLMRRLRPRGERTSSSLVLAHQSRSSHSRGLALSWSPFSAATVAFTVLVVVLSLLTLLPVSNAQNIVYVAADTGDDHEGCGSYREPCHSLNYAAKVPLSSCHVDAHLRCGCAL